MTSAEFLDLSIYASFIMVMLSLAIAFIRLAKGPTLADRVVALDMMTVSIIAVCGVVVVGTGVSALLDVALVLALVGFLATVALARYAERRDARNEESDDD
ncbi:monovalent cation/H+ antiporter complex subunit F [Yoonia algicola]|uniref:Monovalent cation/H+ antiporter complex subunit F n=1 Tax=Yoonia algicola TaxID=3137368 RepID=A0AAN0MHB0_9RHOB